MEYVVGPVIAALMSIAFTEKRLRMIDNKNTVNVKNLEEQIEVVSNQSDKYNQELPSQVMRTLLPVAKEVTKLKQTVGI
tara:strand:- start:222 stop:458 length:237 start_codon:yes stop_codon:yes gene_type:complete